MDRGRALMSGKQKKRHSLSRHQNDSFSPDPRAWYLLRIARVILQCPPWKSTIGDYKKAEMKSPSGWGISESGS